jgi:hypothetical protein
MVDLASLNASITSTATQFHNFAKNIETAHLGNLYTTVIDGLDYYVVECAAKPILEKTPEWVSDNRVVNTILENKGLVILAGGVITFILFIIWLHPKGDAPKLTGPDSKGTTPVHFKKKKEDSGVESDGSDSEKDDIKTKKTKNNAVPKPTGTDPTKTTPVHKEGSGVENGGKPERGNTTKDKRETTRKPVDPDILSLSEEEVSKEKIINLDATTKNVSGDLKEEKEKIAGPTGTVNLNEGSGEQKPLVNEKEIIDLNSAEVEETEDPALKNRKPRTINEQI